MSAGLLAFGALLGSGYAAQKRTSDVVDEARIRKGENPNGSTAISSRGLDHTDAEIRRRAAAAYNGNVRTNAKQIDTQHQGCYSSLAGVYMSKEDFKHSNMTPNFGSTVRQNTDASANKPLLELYTGVGDTYVDKQEIAPMFSREKDVTNVSGLQSHVQWEQQRMVTPRLQNNVFPFQAVKVGPGVGQGYGSAPSGGFQQAAAQDALKPKTIDELRPANNPQVSYTAPPKAGSAYVKNRGSLPNLAKHRPDASAPLPFEYQVGNSATTTKEPMYGCFALPETDRGAEQDYVAPAISKDKGPMQAQEVQPDRRRQVVDYAALGPADAAGRFGLGEDEDYGRCDIQVPMTTRQMTVECTRPGILSSIVHAIVAPLQDVLKPTGKEFHVLAEREFGNLQAQMPPKATVYDPSDVARTTIKELGIHDSEKLNLKGPERGYVIDPDGAKARTTLKEMAIHGGYSVLTGPRCMAVYNVDSAKCTGRETLDEVDYGANVKGPRKTTLPNADKAKVTVRETTIRPARAGNIGTRAAADGYRSASFDAKYTQRLTTSREYSGVADRSKHNMGYDIANVEAKHTTRQVQCDNEYVGPGSAAAKEMMSYLADEAARVDATKEMTLVGRELGGEGPKSAIGKEMLGQASGGNAPRIRGCAPGDLGAAKGGERIVGVEGVNVLLNKQDFAVDDRIERRAVAEQLCANPYAIKPFSAAACQRA